MEWLEIFIAVNKEQLEIAEITLIDDCGLTGVVVHNDDDFNDFTNQPSRNWDYIADELVEEKTTQDTGITFYVTDDDEGKAQLSLIKNTLADLIGDVNFITKGSMVEQDWENAWREFFKPFPVGEKLLIKPSWEELTEDIGDRKILNIDPANVFGNGGHETTKLCLELMESYLHGTVDNYVDKVDNLLDIGCGSGILSIGGLLLGVSTADAVDIETNAIAVAYENCDRNNIARERYNVVAGNILDDKALHDKYSQKNYTIITANIVADIIIALTHKVPDYIADNGIFICSGIISEREHDVVTALESGNFKILEIKREKDWVAIATTYSNKN